ncbi:MAG: hypothetical protein R2809_14190 [Flavobacteriales bacterium]
MKNNIISGLFVLISVALFGQDEGKVSLLESDSTWNQEIFYFPLSFAPEINFEGFEDARFPKYWSNRDSSDFWSYVFVWSISNPVEVTSSSIEQSLKIYFNGLMNYGNSSAVFSEKEPLGLVRRFTGQIQTFDALIQKTDMTLNVSVERYYCDEIKRPIFYLGFHLRILDLIFGKSFLGVKLVQGSCDL